MALQILVNIASAGAVDREFFDIESPPSPHLGTLWANFRLLALLWGALGLPWSRLWPSQAPLGCPLAATGRPLGFLWANFMSLGGPVDPFEPHGAPLGEGPGFGTSPTLMYRKTQQDLRFWNTPREPPELLEPANRFHGPLLGASLHTRRGSG